MTLKIYSPFNAPISTLSFDLDDTLYQNEEVIQQAEQIQFEAICQRVPAAIDTGIEFWTQLKWQVLKELPELCHDVTEWRRKVISLGLAQMNLSADKTPQLTNEIYDIFYGARSDFVVPENTFSVLKKLKQSFRLIAVTNGNANIERIGLAPYFDGYYRAGERNTRTKPYSDLLDLAAKDFNIAPETILHIGDNVTTDVQAAINANCASLWFNPSHQKYPTGYVLPNGEYSQLDDLLQML